MPIQETSMVRTAEGELLDAGDIPVGPIRRRRPKRSMARDGEDTDARGAHYSRTIGRAFDVLERFPDGHSSMNLKEIGDVTGLPMSTLFRTLVTLESRGYLQQEGDGSYRLAPKVLFGRTRDRADRLRASVRPYLQELARRFNETASLAYLFGDVIQVLDTVESFHEVRATNKIGRVLPPHCSSLGKAITAFQPPAQIDRILEVYGLFPRTARTIVDRQAIQLELEAIRDHGCSFDRGEAMADGLCIGVPLRLPSGVVTAAVSVSLPSSRSSEQAETLIIAALQETGGRIEQALATTTDA